MTETVGEIVLMETAGLLPRRLNPRKEFRGIERLAASIERDGIVDPLPSEERLRKPFPSRMVLVLRSIERSFFPFRFFFHLCLNYDSLLLYGTKSINQGVND
jgi:hypothetical protein